MFKDNKTLRTGLPHLYSMGARFVSKKFVRSWIFPTWARWWPACGGTQDLVDSMFFTRVFAGNIIVIEKTWSWLIPIDVRALVCLKISIPAPKPSPQNFFFKKSIFEIFIKYIFFSKNHDFRKFQKIRKSEIFWKSKSFLRKFSKIFENENFRKWKKRFRILFWYFH